MHEVSDLLGREVFSQDTGEEMASVEEVIFDDDTHRVVALLVDDRGAVLGFEVKRGLVRDLAGREQVPIQNVVSHGKDAAIVTDSPLAYPDDPQWQRGREADEHGRECRVDEVSSHAVRGSGEAR